MMTLSVQDHSQVLPDALIGEQVGDGKQEACNPDEDPAQQVLVLRALQGDPEAFTDIVAHYTTTMFRMALMIVGDHDSAEDIVQDTLILAWHHLPALRNSAAFRTWLLRIVYNQSISFKRRTARSSAFMRQVFSEQEIDLVARVADHHKGSLERAWDLAQAIESLPSKQKIAIILHYYNGMTLPEMGRALNISENTLKKRIQAALSNLRRTC